MSQTRDLAPVIGTKQLDIPPEVWDYVIRCIPLQYIKHLYLVNKMFSRLVLLHLYFNPFELVRIGRVTLELVTRTLIENPHLASLVRCFRDMGVEDNEFAKLLPLLTGLEDAEVGSHHLPRFIAICPSQATLRRVSVRWLGPKDEALWKWLSELPNLQHLKLVNYNNQPTMADRPSFKIVLPKLESLDSQESMALHLAWRVPIKGYKAWLPQVTDTMLRGVVKALGANLRWIDIHVHGAGFFTLFKELSQSCADVKNVTVTCLGNSAVSGRKA